MASSANDQLHRHSNSAGDDAVRMSATENLRTCGHGNASEVNDKHCQRVIASLCLGSPADTDRTGCHCVMRVLLLWKHSGLVIHQPGSSLFGALMKAEQAWSSCTQHLVPCPGQGNSVDDM